MLTNIQIMHSALNASVMRHQAISNNIANVNTPKYKPQQVAFEEMLKNAMSDTSFVGKRTTLKHISFGSHANVQPVLSEQPVTMQNSGNGVDVDREMTELTKNSIWFQTLTYQMNEELNLIKAAIRSR